MKEFSDLANISCRNLAWKLWNELNFILEPENLDVEKCDRSFLVIGKKDFYASGDRWRNHDQGSDSKHRSEGFGDLQEASNLQVVQGPHSLSALTEIVEWCVLSYGRERLPYQRRNSH